jgi:hypothetical protein
MIDTDFNLSNNPLLGIMVKYDDAKDILIKIGGKNYQYNKLVLAESSVFFETLIFSCEKQYENMGNKNIQTIELEYEKKYDLEYDILFKYHLIDRWKLKNLVLTHILDY